MITTLLLLVMAAAPETADAPRLQALLQALQRPKSVSADFVQTKVHPAFDKPQVSKGTVYLARPDRLDFNYELPHQVQLRMRGTQVQMYYGRSKRTQTLELSANPQLAVVIDTLTFFVRADPEHLARRYAAHFEGEALVLVPTDPGLAKMISSIRLQADPVRGVLTQVQWVQTDGSLTTLAFESIRVDGPPPAEP